MICLKTKALITMNTYRIKETFNTKKGCVEYIPQIKSWFAWINLGDNWYYDKSNAELVIDRLEKAIKHKVKYYNYKPE